MGYGLLLNLVGRTAEARVVFTELLIQMNQRVYPFVTAGQGSAKEALDSLATDWNATFEKYGRHK